MRQFENLSDKLGMPGCYSEADILETLAYLGSLETIDDLIMSGDIREVEV